MQLHEPGARLDPQLVDEDRAGVAVRLQRLGLPTGAVEGLHQQAAGSLPKRMLRDEALQLAHDIGVAAERELGLDPPLDGQQP